MSSPITTRRLLWMAAAGVAIGLLGVVLLVVLVDSDMKKACGGAGTGPGYAPSKAALSDIPGNYLVLYQEVAARFHLGGEGWSWLAGIGSVETDHGRLKAPGVTSGENSAGAGGPMQFLSGTWDAYAVDGNDDGVKNRYDPRDAIFATARMMKANGAPGDWRRAVFAYNHAGWYVDDVAGRAERYRGAAQADPTLVQVKSPDARVAGPTTFPTAPAGPIIATPADHKARPIGNWQSDNAVDIGVPAGSDVLAVAVGEVVRVSGSPPRRGSGVSGGYSITLRIANSEVFYTHLLARSVQLGDHVKAGQEIGSSGYANNVEHLHIGVENGDPMALWGAGASDQQSSPIGGCAGGAVGPANLGQAVTVHEPRAYATLPGWAMAGGRTPEPVDARIEPDVLWILRTYGLRVSAGREASHESHGNGVSLDMVPAEGNDHAAWDRSALRLAHDIGWIDQCGAVGVAPACPLKPWVRFVGYNGYAHHGDPAHAGSWAHIHVSWVSASGAQGALVAPDEWVRAFPVPTPGQSAAGGQGTNVPVSFPSSGASSRSFVMIGDSLAVGTDDGLASELPGWKVRTDGRVSRPLADGMAHVRALSETPAVLAISLFTNDDPRHVGELEDAVRASLGGQHCVLWATIARPPVGGVSYAAANRALRRLGDQLAPVLHVVDWAAAVADHPGWLTSDGVHPTAAGYAARARLYAQSVQECNT